MKKLELPIHPKLETIFGYPGQAPRVVFYYDPHSGQLMYDDGLESGSANTWAYLLWAAHPSVKGLVNHTAQSASFFLLDRRERKMYTLTREETLEALKAERGAWQAAQPDLLTRLAASRSEHVFGASRSEHVFDASRSQHVFKDAQQLMAEFLLWLERCKAPMAA